MNRLLILIAAAVLVHCAQAQLWLGGHRVVADRERQLMLCSVPEGVFGTDCSLTVEADSTVAALTIGGRQVATGDALVVPELGADSRLPVAVTGQDGSTVAATLQFTFLPIIEFGGEFSKTEYNIVPFGVIMPDGGELASLAKAKYRGSYVNKVAVTKRGFHIKFVHDDTTKRDVKLFGLRNDNSWILDGGAGDLLRVRNRIATDLWNDMAVPPYYAADEPKAMTGVRGQLVEAFVNGGYMGIYNMSEAMDRKQMKLKKYDEQTLEIHGQLWKAADRTPVTLMDTVIKRPTGRLSQYNYFETKYPDFDEVHPTNYDAIYELNLLCATADDSTFAAQIADRLDLPLVMDHYIFLQAALAFDNEGKNVYFACYDRTQSQRLTLGIWDLDTSFGQDWRVTIDPHSSYVQPWRNVYTDFINHHRFLHRLIELDVDSFNERAVARYRELRQGPLATQALIDRFTATVEMLNRAGAAQREQWRYSPDTFIMRTIDLNAELAYIVDWIPRHMAYLDECVFTDYKRVTGDITGDGVVDVDDMNALVNMLLGRATMRTWADLNRDQVIDIGDMNQLVNIMLALGEEQ